MRGFRYYWFDNSAAASHANLLKFDGTAGLTVIEKFIRYSFAFTIGNNSIIINRSNVVKR